MNTKRIGQKLRVCRGNVSARTVAAAVGITPTALSNYELGLRIPRDEVKVALAAYYGLTVQELFFDE